MELIGIENEGEFFPAGTLSEGLQDELREISNHWSADHADNSPLERLKRVASPHYASLLQILNSADPQRRAEVARSAIFALVEALGYTFARDALPTAFDGEPLVPVVGRCVNNDGRDVLWLIEAPLTAPGDEASDPLSLKFEPSQFSPDDRSHAELARSIEEILSDGIFSLKRGPRYLLVVDMAQIILVDRNRWPSRSVLRFDLQEIFSRKDPDTLLTMAGLISREARAPENGVPLAERLEEEAQRNANAVTSSLKATIRDAIEILGQEVLDVTGGKYPVGPKKGNWIDGRDLSRECLRYMYRLLFMFYAEANPRLGILDLRDPVYATGYSIEALRELESVRLRSPVEREGTFLWESLQLTLELIYSGRGGAMKLPAVKVSLLDPESTPVLNALKLRNAAIQKIIKLLSLKRMKSGTSRISYAKLGIGQLGAVYETLISFTGVVAKEDLIELRPKTGRGGGEEETEDSDKEDQNEDVDEDEEGQAVEPESRADKIDLLAPSYFVARHRAAEFKKDEIIFDGADARVYKKGSFIYRLAGRDREKSASYYTPEPLARLLVKHALMERCRDMPADEILSLKILEPAMGSAAFLVETTNQLADLYLERKQQETGRTIPQENILFEKQKVRAYISDRNCFGVDLNPVAVELGAISLWLNSLHRGTFSPWFGDQLHAGNSLIGARRAAYDPMMLKAKKKEDLWFKFPPMEIGWKGTRREGFVWQFLLPAADMAAFDKDKSIAEFAGPAQQSIKDWRKGGFFAKFEPHEVKLVQKLSSVADQLFEEVAESLARSRSSTNDYITIWPDREMPGVKGESFHEKQRRLEKLTGDDHAANTLPYKRLKTAMDAWCGLWLWPLDKADMLPSRLEFLNGMAMILEGGFSADGSLAAPSIAEFPDPAPDLFHVLEPEAPANDLFRAAEKRQSALFRETNVEALVEAWPWLGVAVKVAEEARFAHLDLIFADVLKSRGGFDIIVGNPPWAKPSWNEGDVIGDIDPGFITKNLSAPEARDARSQALVKDAARKSFLSAFTSTKGAMVATGSAVMNPFAGSGSNNLYRCFIDLCFRFSSPKGVSALIHQDGHLSDPKASLFRKHWYSRIIHHFDFSNKLTTKNFSEVLHTKRFSLNLYRGTPSEVNFTQFTNAFVASQIDDSFRHDGLGSIPGIKNSGSWETRGHKKRLMKIDQAFLDLVSRLLGLAEGDTGISPPLLQLLSNEQVAGLQKLGDHRSFGDKDCKMHFVRYVDEADAQKRGVLEKTTHWPDMGEKYVISPPSLYSGNPLAKSPRRVCKVPQHYDKISHGEIPDSYRPRSNFKIISKDSLSNGCFSDLVPWDPSTRHFDFFRFAFRRRVDLGTERSFSGAIIPPNCLHTDQLTSISFHIENDLLNSAAIWISIIPDFIIKSLRQADIRETIVSRLPFIKMPNSALARVLLLTCVSEEFSPLWNRNFELLKKFSWSITSPKLSNHRGTTMSPIWGSSFRLNEFERRLACIELDVISAQAFGLSLEQFLSFLSAFPLLEQNDAGTYFDLRGSLAWTNAGGVSGVGYTDAQGVRPSKSSWEEIVSSNPTDLRCDATIDFLPGGPHMVERVFEGPFGNCNRIEDYKRAWTYFEAHSERNVAA